MINYNLTIIKGLVFDVDGVLSPATVPMNDNGEPQRMVNIKDGYALQLAIKEGYKIAIITGSTTESVRHRYEALGIKDIYLGASNKLEVLKKWLAEVDLSAENVLYMGDDIPDLQCMERAGLSCTPADGCIEARKIACYTSHVNGGYGCARDVIEQVMKANGNWMKDTTAFGW